MPYPHLGFGEDYIETPSTTKRGFIVPVTKEAIFFDRTHLVLSRAAEVGEVLGLNKEKRLIDLVIGATNNYKWKGTTYNTYQTSTPWINVADRQRAGRLDRTSTRPSSCSPTSSIRTRASRCWCAATTVLVMPAYRHAAHRVFNAAEIDVHGGRLDDGHGGGQSAGQLPRVRQPAGVSADRRLGRRGGRRPRSGGSSAISARRSPTWRTGRSPSRSRRPAAKPSSTTTSCCGSKPASGCRRGAQSAVRGEEHRLIGCRAGGGSGVGKEACAGAMCNDV